ncbi:hypothetical protein IKF03_00410 [Candidatus Saccharibacteria bacterium]|nr:hypothetical protein [Candidatus Saccharibacteria bacterium]
MKVFKRIFSMIASVAMVAVPVFMMSMANATTTFEQGPASGDPVSNTGGDNVDIKRKVNDVTDPVTNTFTYTITPDTTYNPTGSTITGAPTTATITFTNVAPVSGTAESSTNVSFAGTDFNKPGDYRFKIEETGTTDATTYPLDSDDWYIYVQVRNVLGTNNVPTGDFKATVLKQGTENTSTTKEDITFEQSANLTYLQLSKEVTGNVADRNKYFKFEVTFTSTVTPNPMIGKKFIVTGAHSDNGTAAVTGSDEHTVDTNGKITIWLKHGETVKIGQTATGTNQIPIGTTYTIAESERTGTILGQTETYKTYIDVPIANITATTPVDADAALDAAKTAVATPPAQTDPNYATMLAAFNAGNVTSYVNNLEADPLTGVFNNFWPYILLLTLGAIGAYIIVKTSKEKEEVEQ